MAYHPYHFVGEVLLHPLDLEIDLCNIRLWHQALNARKCVMCPCLFIIIFIEMSSSNAPLSIFVMLLCVTSSYISCFKCIRDPINNSCTEQSAAGSRGCILHLRYNWISILPTYSFFLFFLLLFMQWVDCSIIILRILIWSMHDLLLLKPACSLRSWLSIFCLILFNSTLGSGTERYLPKTDESVVRPAGERC